MSYLSQLSAGSNPVVPFFSVMTVKLVDKKRMTMRQIEDKHGLPCRVRIPFARTDHRGEPQIAGYLERDVLRRSEQRSEWYIQRDPQNPDKGEFTMCYEESIAKKYFANLEFIKNLEE